MTAGGRVVELWRYPLKSAAGEKLDSLEVDASGAIGDRQWALQNVATGDIMTLNTNPRLLLVSARICLERAAAEPELEISVPGGDGWHSGAAASRVLSAWLGLRVEVRRWNASATQSEGTLRFDYGFPVEGQSRVGFVDELDVVHIVSVATLRWMETDGWSDARRTRPNVVLDLGDEPFAEDLFLGAEFSVGDARFTGMGGTERCQLIESSQPGLASRPTLLERVRRERAGKIGIYARQTQSSRLHVGDHVHA